MVWIAAVFFLLFVSAAVEYALLCLKGRWKLLALLPLAVTAAAGGILLYQSGGSSGWLQFEYQLDILVFVLPTVAGIALGAALRGVAAFLSWIGNR